MKHKVGLKQNTSNREIGIQSGAELYALLMQNLVIVADLSEAKLSAI